MNDSSYTLLGYVIAWLPMLIFIAVYAYFTLRLVKAISNTSAALDRVAQKLDRFPINE